MPRRKKSKRRHRRYDDVSWDKWSFNAAWIISLVLAFGVSLNQEWASIGIWSIILVILGIVTGFMHSTKEVAPIILVAVALAIFTGSSLAIIPVIGDFLNELVTYFISYLTPAALIIALRRVYKMFN